jgi:hypothetical protein
MKDIENKTPAQEEKVEETKAVEKPKKKGNGCLIAILIILFILVGIGVAGYLGYKKILKLTEGKDLGVAYTQQDYDDLMNNIGLEAEPEVLCLDCTATEYSDSKEIEITVSNAQASAAFEYVNEHMSFAKISGTQIKMGDGQAELVTSLTFQGKTFPIYMSGTVSKSSENSITGEVYDLKAGGLNLPSNINTLVEEGLLTIANQKLSSAGDTVRIDSLDLTEGGLKFDGLVPSKVK